MSGERLGGVDRGTGNGAGNRAGEGDGDRRPAEGRMLRALAHPVRVAIVEALAAGGPLTATEAGGRIGESATTCSFHLRQLAKYGLVEEAGGGRGRARPWRLTTVGAQVSAGEDSESELALVAVTQLFRERALTRYRTWLEQRGTYPRPWRRAAGESQSVLYLTADELDELSEDLYRFLGARFPERLTDPSTRPPGAIAVEMLVLSYPIESADGQSTKMQNGWPDGSA